MILLLTIAILAFGVCVSSRLTKQYYLPFNIFATFNCALFGGYWLINKINGTVIDSEITWLVFIGLISQAVGMVTFWKVAFYPHRNPDWIYSVQNLKKLKLLIWFVLSISVAMATYKVVSKGSANIYDLYSFDQAMTVDNSDIKTRCVGMISRIIAPLFIICLAFTFHAPCFRDKLVFYYFPLCVYLATLFTGYIGRSVIITLLGASITLHFAYKKKFQFVSAILIFFSFAFLLSVLQMVRHGKDIDSVGRIAGSLGEGGEWEPVQLIESVYEYEKNIDFDTCIGRLEVEFANFVINWVPRPLWPNKPETDFASRTSNNYFGNTYANQLWVRNFTVIGQGYYVGGEIGVALFCYLYGAATMFFIRAFRGVPAFEWYSHSFTILAAYMFRNSLGTIVFVGFAQFCVMSIIVRVLNLKTRSTGKGYERRLNNCKLIR